jgi:hypothetical protein
MSSNDVFNVLLVMTTSKKNYKDVLACACGLRKQDLSLKVKVSFQEVARTMKWMKRMNSLKDTKAPYIRFAKIL